MEKAEKLYFTAFQSSNRFELSFYAFVCHRLTVHSAPCASEILKKGSFHVETRFEPAVHHGQLLHEFPAQHFVRSVSAHHLPVRLARTWSSRDRRGRHGNQLRFLFHYGGYAWRTCLRVRACASVRDDPVRLSMTVQELLILNLIMGAVAYGLFSFRLFSSRRLPASRRCTSSVPRRFF